VADAGAVRRVGESDTAFNNRDAGFTFNINGNSKTAEGFEAERAWAAPTGPPSSPTTRAFSAGPATHKG
jgi:hypothetical protein